MKFAMCLLILLMLLMPGLSEANDNNQPFPIWPTTDEQEAPDVYGKIVVWQQFVSEYGDYDIFIADLNNPSDPLVNILGDESDQMNPAIFENYIVWQDFVSWQGLADWDIRMADISDQTEPNIYVISDIANNDEQNPAIHGNIVVWEDGFPGNINIYGADITNPAGPMEFLIAGLDVDQQNPVIYRNTVVWQDSYDGNWDIYAADIWRRNLPLEFPVSILKNDQQNPAISGNIIVWQDNFFGDWDIYAADISEPNNPVKLAIATNDSPAIAPDIDGSVIVWQDNRNNNWDIFGYNLVTGLEFQVTYNRYDQTNPAISGNVVVWQDYRNGNSEVYAVILDGPEAAKCTSKVSGDVNGDCKVDFDDFALMTSHWLECNIEPAETCL